MERGAQRVGVGYVISALVCLCTHYMKYTLHTTIFHAHNFVCSGIGHRPPDQQDQNKQLQRHTCAVLRLTRYVDWIRCSSSPQGSIDRDSRKAAFGAFLQLDQSYRRSH